ncbi:MAG: ribonuclease HI [candidate division KSB1 bacterium]|nr:ribonuclease HI [candidate division KSB1 bacterium]MDQ7066090.1 ribonuclease HI [candidate division KSB1 bacterium]
MSKKKPTREVDIYTDGACSGNPGPGGWAAILISGEHEKVLSGHDPQTTNNRMELTAVIEALKALKYPCKVTIYSDSAYLVNAIRQGWLDKWQRQGWTRGKPPKPVLNVDLWKELLKYMSIHDVTFKKVLGHAGHPLNERADRIAVQEIKKAVRGRSQE